jgi:hypothetical protein
MEQYVWFDDFLNTLQMDEETYVLAFNFRLQRLTILLKWNPIDICTNSYGKFVDKLW